MGTTLGKAPPWAWTRRRLARTWNVPPWEVDAAPAREVARELWLDAIEHEVAAWKPR